jgi:hypothetical protein
MGRLFHIVDRGSYLSFSRGLAAGEHAMVRLATLIFAGASHDLLDAGARGAPCSTNAATMR